MSVRCLVADDHPALLLAVRDYLVQSGFDVVATAPDGVEAVTLAAEHRPDVAVVDFRMPRLAGTELLEELRDASPETRIAVYTAEADEVVVHGVIATGASGILLKESPLGDLVRALETALGGSTYLDPALAHFAVGQETGKPFLTDREQSVLRLLAEGMTHEEIGARLSIGPETVRTHVRKACDRLGASTRTHAVATALRLGLIA